MAAAHFLPILPLARTIMMSVLFRMWEFYLAGCECFFQSQAGMVFQLQLGQNYKATPLGRRYIAQKEDSYRDILCKTIFFGNTPPSTK